MPIAIGEICSANGYIEVHELIVEFLPVFYRVAFICL